MAPPTEPQVLSEPVHPRAARRGPDLGLLMAIALVVVVAALVVKPWAGGGGAAPAGAGSSPAAPVATAPASPSGGPASASPDVLGVGPAPPPTPTFDPTAVLENADPIAPATWSAVSAGVRQIDRDAVVFVARGPAGLYWQWEPVEPGTRLSLTETGAGGGAAGSAATDTVRMTGDLATPVAIGLARPTGEPAPFVVAWQILGPGASILLPVRHPVGDLDRFLILGPGLDIPRGEQGNRREISQWPPMWLEGVYRFDLDAADGTRHVFVVLEPGAGS